MFDGVFNYTSCYTGTDKALNEKNTNRLYQVD